MKKRFTRKSAIRLCIELWTWCAQTGRHKNNWPKWPTIRTDYNRKFTATCPFCEYVKRIPPINVACESCPYKQVFGYCWEGPFHSWGYFSSRRIKSLMADAFLKQLKTLK